MHKMHYVLMALAVGSLAIWAWRSWGSDWDSGRPPPTFPSPSSAATGAAVPPVAASDLGSGKLGLARVTDSEPGGLLLSVERVRQWLAARGMQEGAALTKAEREEMLECIASCMAAEVMPIPGDDATAARLLDHAVKARHSANLTAMESGSYVVVRSRDPFGLANALAAALHPPEYYFTLVKVIRPTQDCVITVLSGQAASDVTEASMRLARHRESIRKESK